MYATIRSYHGVDQNRTAELTAKVNETLVPKLSELPGFAGYYLVDAGNGIFTSFGLFETREQGEASTKLVARWIRDEKLDTLMPTSPRSRAARSSLAAASASWSRSSTAPHIDGRGPACRALSPTRRRVPTLGPVRYALTPEELGSRQTVNRRGDGAKASRRDDRPEGEDDRNVTTPTNRRSSQRAPIDVRSRRPSGEIPDGGLRPARLPSRRRRARRRQ